MRPSFELKSLPPDAFLKPECNASQMPSSIQFDVVEESSGGLTLSVSRRPVDTRTAQWPAAPSEPCRAPSNYIENENPIYFDDSRQSPSSSLRRFEDMPSNPLPQEGSDMGSLDMTSFMLPSDPSGFVSSPSYPSYDNLHHHHSFGNMPVASTSMRHTSRAGMNNNEGFQSAGHSPFDPNTAVLSDNLLGIPSPCTSNSSSSPAAMTPKSLDVDDSPAPAETPSSSSSSSGTRKRPRNFPCKKPNCNRVFTSSYTRDAHMLTHRPKDKKSYECTVGCGACFSRQHDRWRHEVTQHGKPSQWTCTRCSQYFSSQRGLEMHKNVCNASLSTTSLSGPSDGTAGSSDS